MQRRTLSHAQLLSVPPRMARAATECHPGFSSDWFVASDPPGARLGSGGGTTHLLVEAWRDGGGGRPFADWLGDGCRLVMHAGGQSRRLPAYAVTGKAFIPMPVMRWSLGQGLQQTLVDLQQPVYNAIRTAVGGDYAMMLASGDALVRFTGPIPPAPRVDFLGIGLWSLPEQAQHHGVFFCERRRPDRLAFFLQKPSADQIRELSAEYVYLIDSGLWLLSSRAVLALARKSGWDHAGGVYRADGPAPYEFYAELATGLGERPKRHDADLDGLTAAVLALPRGTFYHFGSSRDLIASVGALQYVEVDQLKSGAIGPKPEGDVHTLNAVTAVKAGAGLHGIWIENATVPAGWTLAGDHVITGVPDNDWSLELESGVCLDFSPVDDDAWCIRCYGIDDSFRGAVDDPATRWLGRPARNWFAARGLNAADAGVAPGTDLQDAPLFPVVRRAQLSPGLVRWLSAAAPADQPEFVTLWRSACRLSAADLQGQVNLARLYAQRRRHLQAVLLPMARNHRRSVFYRLDLLNTAQLFAPGDLVGLPEMGDGDEPLKRVNDEMFRSAVLRRHDAAAAAQHEKRAFDLLRDLVLREMELQPVRPRLDMQEDQIVWGRSPLRLDLAGGWTDTPPYCLQHGGSVVNVAVNLNGQPPIQVFARRTDRPELVVHSIDLGVEERVRAFEELERYDQIGSGFTVAKAAFALAGFLPRFHAGPAAATLAEHLQAMGGGLEVSLLCAVPKGSGLGTSSVLAATLLGTLSECCGLGWDHYHLFRRTLALEQMLTSGGGWQDQGGGLLHGLKLIETQPGLDQKPTVRWLPERFFCPAYANRTVLLYYTGITRVAQTILREIVRGMFLNAREHLAILDQIGRNAVLAADVVQRDDWAGFCEAVRRTWELKQRLDAGTNPPEVRRVVDPLAEHLDACTLLGAGGGGYLLMLARDEDSAGRIREALNTSPPNPRARFVDLEISTTGFQVTRS